MQNFINRYVVWIILAIGLHVLLLMVWPSIHQPVQLRLQSGYQTVSLKFSPSQTRQVTESVEKQSSHIDATQSQPSPAIETAPSQTTPLIPQNKQPLAQTPLKSLDAKKPITKTVTTTPVVNQVQGEIVKKPAIDIPLTAEPPLTAETGAPITPISPVLPVTPITQAPSVVAAQDITSESDNELSSLAEVQPKGVLAMAKPLSANNPKYPRRAIIRNQQGRVKVIFLVDKDGYVENIELVESSGYALLDESVLRFAEQEQFLPATQDGNPIASTQSYLFRFVLE